MDPDKTDNPDDLKELASLVRTQLGHNPSSITRVAAGLGNRRFYRVHFSKNRPASVIARIETTRDAPVQPTPPDPSAWLPEPLHEPLRHFLESAGLRVPGCLAHLPDRGIDLLEDVGDRTLQDVDDNERTALYQQACEIVPRLQRLSASPNEIPAFGRIFDRPLILTKAWKWLHWTIPGLLERPATEEESNTLHGLFEAIAVLLDEAPRRFAHRDFKAENLHLIPANSSAPEHRGTKEQIVMIDLQGGFMAPPEYDLACLLYDLQVELEEPFIMDCFSRTIGQLPDDDGADLAAVRFNALATLRLCKDLSHLVYAASVRNDWRRWQEIPRGLALLSQTTRRLQPNFPEIQILHSILPALANAFESSKNPKHQR